LTGERLARVPSYVFVAVVVVTGLVFGISGLVMDGGFQRAWEILLALRSPFGQASGLGVALSALGYVAVPAVIGLVVADGITRFTRRRLLTTPEARAEIKRLAREATAGQTPPRSQP
jgi:hypothetical protein